MKRIVSLAVWMLATAGGFLPIEVPAQTNDAWRQAPVTSQNRHFIVTGMPKTVAVDIAVWAESVYRLIEEWAGSPVPGNFPIPLIIEATVRTNDVGGFAIAEQFPTEDGFIRQRLLLVNLESLDQEDALEGLCRLLLNRWILVRQSDTERLREPRSFPAWFAVGVAQNLYPDLRERNLATIESEESDGRYRAASTVAALLVVPPGRWPEKAQAGLVTAWLFDQAPADIILSAAAQAVAVGGELSETALLRISGTASLSEFDRQWDVWMAARQQRIRPGTDAADTATLVRILEMRTDDLGLVHHDIASGERVPVSRLIDERDQRWAREVCSSMAWQLQREVVGKNAEIRDAVQPFQAFFALMLDQPEAAKELSGAKTPAKKKEKPPSARALRKAWRKAESGWTAYLQQASVRRDYIDAVERSVAPPEQAVREALNTWEFRVEPSVSAEPAR